MTTASGVIGISAILMFIAGTPASAHAVSRAQPARLSDAQLDHVAAGTPVGVVTASGDSNAKGDISFTEAQVSSEALSGGSSDAVASGRVTSFAISQSGPLASASSTLSLSVFMR